MSVQQGSLDLSALRGTVAVVTGAGHGGIGWGLAKSCAELGMHVAFVDLQEAAARSAAEELSRLRPEVRCVGLACDVASWEAMEACAAAVEREFAGVRLGAVFANAGVLFTGKLLSKKPSVLQEWQKTMAVNVLGTVHTIRAFAPFLQRHAAPSVLCCTASVSGLVRGDGAGTAAYQASKHAVISTCESLSFELAERSPQVRVHVLCPCIVASQLPQTSSAVLAADKPADGPPGAHLAMDLAMTTERHAQQVWDRIARGEFYVITENVRPYVDHDFPWGAPEIITERLENVLQHRLDNADAFKGGSAILKGPLYQELGRRMFEEKKRSKL